LPPDPTDIDLHAGRRRATRLGGVEGRQDADPRHQEITMTDQTAIAPAQPRMQPNDEGFYELQGNYTFRMGRKATKRVFSEVNDYSYIDDDEASAEAWRIFHDGYTDMHMPADWSPERVKETFEWYLRGEKAGEEYGIKLGKNQVSNAVEMLRDLGIGTVLLPAAVEY
jgi:hypothetical protein